MYIYKHVCYYSLVIHMICLETTSRCKFKYIFMILAIESICSHFLVNCFPFTVNELNLLISIINRIGFYHLWQKIKQIIVTKTGYNLISISHKVSLEGDSIETFKPQKPKHLAVLRPAFSHATLRLLELQPSISLFQAARWREKREEYSSSLAGNYPKIPTQLFCNHPID